ncbi:MAG: divalent metal cation transporter [Actinobacteria bacterium]|nr:divalent metal cation transporter [Actinomycetota bacterium]
MAARLERVRNGLADNKSKLMLFLAVLGPGIITAAADNDASGITTYSLAGAKTGYALLWMLILITFSLGVTQEIGARIGLVTGKGLGGLIREKFGLKLTSFAMLTMLVANLGTTIAEFAGVAAAMEIFGISKYIAVPVAATLVFLVVLKWGYDRIRKVFLISALVYIVYIISGTLAHPNWSAAARGMMVPSFKLSKEYLIAFIATIGTTITPWGQFFIQSYAVDKRMSIRELNYARADVYFGAFLTDFIAYFIIIACAATIWALGRSINDAKDAALALRPLAGNFASTLFAFGLVNASLLGASILPLSSAYATCEAFGWEAGIDHKLEEAPQFYGIYSFFIVVAALITLIPGAPLVKMMFTASAVNGVLLPIILIYVMKIANDQEIMGDYTNGRAFNTIAWGTIIFIIAVTIALLAAMTLGLA